MKDPEFIELLNLYVDHEITSVDAARLEAEVAQNPARAVIITMRRPKRSPNMPASNAPTA